MFGNMELTSRQKQIFEFIQNALKSHGVAPSLREIAGHFKLSYGTIQTHLEGLKKKGALETSRSHHRNLLPSHWKTGFTIPILGQVRAGMPTLAEENIESYVAVDRQLGRGGKLFALRVRGDSMRDAGMVEGDIVIVRQQATAQNGDIVVAQREDEATVKYFRERPGGAWLEPANSAYKPMPAADFSILGKVTGLMRNYGG
jgi:repressor LexA